MPEYITIIPGKATLPMLEHIWHNNLAVKLEQSCRPDVERGNAIITKIAQGQKPIYGINTGFGKLANVRIPPAQTVALQRNIILSHCCGVGKPLSRQIVRLTMVLKILSLERGASGISWPVLELMADFLKHDILPVIPSQGSVGASGDLAPLAHLTAALIGVGQVQYQGKVMDTSSALQKANLKPVILGPKEGLSMINGTQVSTALALAGLFEAWHNIRCAITFSAMTTDAIMGSTAPLHPEIHRLRGHKGQIDTAAILMELLKNSEIRQSHQKNDPRVQDPYCIRCQPQVLGACIDLLRQVANTLLIEANGVTDNPLIVAKEVAKEDVISGGNFHAEPVAFAADQIALAIAEIGSLAQRQVAMLIDPALNYGLPPFLSSNPGLHSGMMIAEIVTAALMSENKQKANPCSTDSIPTSANQEDHVSMACHAAFRLIDMNQNLRQLLSIQLMITSQAIEYRLPLKTSPHLQKILRLVRKTIPTLKEDRFLAQDIDNSTKLTQQPSFNNLLAQITLKA